MHVKSEGRTHPLIVMNPFLVINLERKSSQNFLDLPITVLSGAMDDTHKSQKCTCITAGILVWKTGTGFVVVEGYEPNPCVYSGLLK